MLAWVVLLLLHDSAFGLPDPVLERVVKHKRDLNHRGAAGRQLTLSDWLGSQRNSRQLEHITLPPDGASQGGQVVRLVGGPGPWEGAVQVHTGSGWHSVVANRWSEVEASVVCRQLGHVSYFSASPGTTAGAPSLNSSAPAPVGFHKCSGSEVSLLDCARAEVDSPQPAAVSCLSPDDLSSRCPAGELPFGDGCYHVGREPVTRLKAELLCRQRNARLVVVNSQLKNDFLSGVLSYLGLEGFHTAGRDHRAGEDISAWYWEGSDKPFSFTKWGPDGSESDRHSLEPRCLTLEPSAAATDASYAFWKASDCSRRLQYVCEAPRNWTDCASGVADLYSGTASTAESGRPCLAWSTVADLPGFSSASLPENHCRNPDGDQRPWCFTEPDQFEYCDVPACPPRLPQLVVPAKDNYTCNSAQFACAPGECTRVTYVCDGDKDCSNGRDESVCDALAASFQTFSGKQLKFGSDVKPDEVYAIETGVNLRTCQFLCLVDPSCFAIQYISLLSRCARVVLPLGTVRLVSSSLDSVHVVLSRYQPCSGHRCDDFECVNKTNARCDGVADCQDASDENECAREAPVSLRLVGGAEPTSGRLEALFQGRWGLVCDDGFSTRSADVACRQLGFRRFRRFFVNGRRYPAGADDRFSVSFSICSGREESFGDCILLNQADRCDVGEHVSLECTNEPGTCTLLPNFFECLDSSACVAPSQMCDGKPKCSDGSDEGADACQQFRVRLVGDTVPQQVQLKPELSDRPFLAVTGRGFGEQEADFLCRSMDRGLYGIASEDPGLLPESEYVAQVSCRPSSDCAVRRTTPGPTAHGVRLRCFEDQPPAPQLRLVGGDESSGLLEVLPPLGSWGRVCSAAFNAAQAQVACRQLGFSGESTFLKASRSPDAMVSLRAMDCLGDEEAITDCFRQPWTNATGPWQPWQPSCEGHRTRSNHDNLAVRDTGLEVCGGDDGGEVYLSCNASAPATPPPVQVALQCAADAADPARVLGGSAAPVDEQAWFARVDSRRDGDWALRCGATVISERFVLTAAHCVEPTAGERLQGLTEVPLIRLSVAVGGNGRRRQRAAIASVTRHPGHRQMTDNSDDLALLRLEEKLTFSEAVQPACLPPAHVTYSPSLPCIVTGLGKTGELASSKLPEQKRVGRVSLFPRAECEAFYGRRNITLGMVCAGNEFFSVDTCDGDSGGPLTCELGGGGSVLMGITSWGPGCGRSGQPGVYTRVATYLPWIQAIVHGDAAA